MAFSSNIFLFLFIPVFFCAYFGVPARWRNGLILGASLLFYFFGAPGALPILLVSILLNYLIGLALFNRPTLPLLFIGVAANLAFLL
jgi:alginate O-acetyltransferase complex protein AlgI